MLETEVRGVGGEKAKQSLKREKLKSASVVVCLWKPLATFLA